MCQLGSSLAYKIKIIFISLRNQSLNFWLMAGGSYLLLITSLLIYSSHYFASANSLFFKQISQLFMLRNAHILPQLRTSFDILTSSLSSQFKSIIFCKAFSEEFNPEQCLLKFYDNDYLSCSSCI